MAKMPSTCSRSSRPGSRIRATPSSMQLVVMPTSHLSMVTRKGSVFKRQFSLAPIKQRRGHRQARQSFPTFTASVEFNIKLKRHYWLKFNGCAVSTISLSGSRKLCQRFWRERPLERKRAREHWHLKLFEHLMENRRSGAQNLSSIFRHRGTLRLKSNQCSRNFIMLAWLNARLVAARLCMLPNPTSTGSTRKAAQAGDLEH